MLQSILALLRNGNMLRPQSKSAGRLCLPSLDRGIEGMRPWLWMKDLGGWQVLLPQGPVLLAADWPLELANDRKHSAQRVAK